MLARYQKVKDEVQGNPQQVE